MADAFKVFQNKDTAELAAQIAQQKRPDVSGAAPTVIDYQGDRGITLLMWALLHGNLEAMSDLINYGADPALGDEDGYTVLHLAAKIDNPDGLLTLLEHFLLLRTLDLLLLDCTRQNSIKDKLFGP